MRIFAAILGAAALTCGSMAQFQSSQIPSSQTQFGPVVQWTQVHQGVHCALTQQEIRVIGSERDWKSYFDRAFPADPGTKRDIPVVANWTKEIIIAIHAGRQPTPGYSLNVSTIARRQTGIYDIDTIFERPNPQAMMAQVTTSPWVIIKVQRTVGTPRLRVIETTSRVIRASGPSRHGGWGDCWAEMPIYRVGEGGKLIPLNDEARRRMGLPPEGGRKGTGDGIG